ncbi:uncharacterized protein [Solanum tuberosum]|uniref:uncharacterized protein n=1 Tax=Solanum tuberosum TaxID=4113 RepID=UPI00073A24FD|nr:PREDICTED: uncharacterized protein LOC107062048 [Solanum tuberosum]
MNRGHQEELGLGLRGDNEENNQDNVNNQENLNYQEVHINLPLVDILQGIPKYGKYVKEVLANQRRLTEYETVALTEECSSRIQNRLPKKLKDPGSFTVQITIRQSVHARGLCVLGASINLMPLSLYRKLGLGSPKRTTVILQLADRSITRPEGVVEDVLVQVGSLICSVDFVVLDVKPDFEVPFILGHPFLATGRTLIDVEAGQLNMRVHEKVEVCRPPSSIAISCARDPLERVLVGHEVDGDTDAQEIETCLNLALVETHKCRVESLDRELGPPPKPSIEETPKLELKTLPAHLSYAFLGANETLQVILSAELSEKQVDAALRILKQRKKTIG